MGLFTVLAGHKPVSTSIFLMVFYSLSRNEISTAFIGAGLWLVLTTGEMVLQLACLRFPSAVFAGYSPVGADLLAVVLDLRAGDKFPTSFIWTGLKLRVWLFTTLFEMFLLIGK
jgi:hypothetical protein